MPIFEQAKRMKLCYEIYHGEFSYSQTDSETETEFEKVVAHDALVDQYIVKDGILVGVMLENKRILIGQKVCFYSYVDEDGPWSEIGHKYVSLLYKDE